MIRAVGGPFESQAHRKAFSKIAKGTLGKQLSG